MQGSLTPVEPVQLGATAPGYPQPMPPAPRAMPGWPPAAPGLLPEPAHQVAGAPRELMLTPEVLPPRPERPAPPMMLTPQQEAQAPFEGRYMMLTPQGQTKANATVEAARQRRDAAVQSYQAQQAAAQASIAQTAGAQASGAQMAGNEQEFAGPRERFERRHERRQERREDLRTLRQNRFPSAHALDEAPEGE